MHLLLDTHLLLWWLKNDPALTPKARTLIKNADEVFISSASIWELAIKISLKKLKVDINELVISLPDEGFTELPITMTHTIAIANMPHHHRDPFDRILIAQAQSEPLKLLTADKTLAAYSDLVEVV